MEGKILIEMKKKTISLRKYFLDDQEVSGEEFEKWQNEAQLENVKGGKNE